MAVSVKAMTADQDVEYGAHLPLIDLGTPLSLPALRAYVRAAARLGYRHLCANDHVVFDRPWLDGPTALAALVVGSTTVTVRAIPVGTVVVTPPTSNVAVGGFVQLAIAYASLVGSSGPVSSR